MYFYRSLCCLIALLVSLLFPCLVLAGDKSGSATEYEIKAAFLFSVNDFLTWPESSFSSDNAPFYLCVLGRDPFGKKLDIIIEDKTLKTHPVLISRINDVTKADNCHTVFISKSETRRLPMIFNELSDKSILTVSDIPKFINHGGMIKFFTHKNKVRLALNPDSFKSAKLKPSADLFRVSQIVQLGDDE